MSSALLHYGVLGMKWGIRRYQNKDGSVIKPKDLEYSKHGNLEIKSNKDGSKSIPSGFIFNRVGKASMDINQSGALYVSYGKDDAARYIKSLGPTLIGDLLGTSHDTVQHITTTKEIKVPSTETVIKETATLLSSNKKLFESFNESIYSTVVTGDFEPIPESTIKKVLNSPSGKDGHKVAYAVSSFLGDPNYASESETVYRHFRDAGYDAIPDLHDILSGTSKTALIVINPEKLKVTSTTRITKDISKAGKTYVKSLEKLPVSELIK